nr:MAG TPA: hypothetical protein [Caudoviricetes sp.]
MRIVFTAIVHFIPSALGAIMALFLHVLFHTTCTPKFACFVYAV